MPNWFNWIRDKQKEKREMIDQEQDAMSQLQPSQNDEEAVVELVLENEAVSEEEIVAWAKEAVLSTVKSKKRIEDVVRLVVAKMEAR